MNEIQDLKSQLKSLEEKRKILSMRDAYLLEQLQFVITSLSEVNEEIDRIEDAIHQQAYSERPKTNFIRGFWR